ncbi:MAG: hypothetical protein JNM85_02695 [Chthonomonas sp.]|nr:hypothetical protein [Chthonomonas sp.]
MRLSDCIDQTAQQNLVRARKDGTGEASPLIGAPLKRDELWELAPRAVEVVSQMLDGAVRGKGAMSPIGKWGAWMARFLWILVEATVPRRPFYRLFGYWFQVILTILVFGFIVTLLMPGTDLGTFFAKGLGAAIVVWLLAEWVRSWVFRAKDRLMNLSATLSFMAALLLPFVMLITANVPVWSLSDSRSVATWILSLLLLLPALGRGLWILGLALRRGWRGRGAKKALQPGRHPLVTRSRSGFVRRFESVLGWVGTTVYVLSITVLTTWLFNENLRLALAAARMQETQAAPARQEAKLDENSLRTNSVTPPSKPTLKKASPGGSADAQVDETPLGVAQSRVRRMLEELGSKLRPK